VSRQAPPASANRVGTVPKVDRVVTGLTGAIDTVLVVRNSCFWLT